MHHREEGENRAALCTHVAVLSEIALWPCLHDIGEMGCARWRTPTTMCTARGARKIRASRTMGCTVQPGKRHDAGPSGEQACRRAAQKRPSCRPRAGALTISSTRPRGSSERVSMAEWCHAWPSCQPRPVSSPTPPVGAPHACSAPASATSSAPRSATRHAQPRRSPSSAVATVWPLPPWCQSGRQQRTSSRSLGDGTATGRRMDGRTK